MNFYSKRRPMKGHRYGLGFKSKTQLPLLMVWKEWWRDGEVVHAEVLLCKGFRHDSRKGEA